MKRKIIYIILGIATLFGCDDLLDKYPLASPSSATFPLTSNELELGVNAAYGIFSYLPSNNVLDEIYLDGATDLGWIRGDYANYQTIGRGETSATLSRFSSTWTYYYKYIGRCCFILDNMDNVEDITTEEKEQREGELRFLRAYGYSKLTEFYGDVCLVKHQLDIESSKSITRSPKSEVVDFILDDLDFAVDVLPDSYASEDEGRVTKGAALGLKARVALYNKQYDVATEAAKDVIENGTYQLYPDYENMFTYNGIRNSEVILDVPFHADYMYSHLPQLCFGRIRSGFSLIVPSQNLIDSYECIDGLSIDKSPLYDPAKIQLNRDPRLNASVVLPNTWYLNYLFQTHPDSIKTYDSAGNRITNTDVTNAYATFTGYLWKKYCVSDDIGKVQKSTLNIILMRYAEILLTYAEAKIELNEIDQSVYNAINEIRQRAGMPLITTGKLQEEMRYIVRHERKIELAGEGFRLFDIRRWKIAEYVMPGKFAGRKQKANWYTPEIPAINEYDHPVYQNFDATFITLEVRSFNPDRDYLWAIPQSEIDATGGLTQNSGY
jgi:hypothetical protein